MAPPEALLACAEAPPVPGPGASDAELARFLVADRAALLDCRSTISRIRQWVAANKQP